MKLPHHLADTALSRLFLESRFAQDVVTFSLPGGSTLYEAGEEADHIYFLRAISIFCGPDGLGPFGKMRVWTRIFWG